MKLRTHIKIEPFARRLDYTQHGLFLGSCFADSIGRRMVQHRMPVTLNPFGILFNPASVAGSLERLREAMPFRVQELTHVEDHWVSLAHHGSFSGEDPEQVLKGINTALSTGAQALQEASYVVVTWGTAWVYEHCVSGQIVGNCHRIPACEFVRRALTVDEIVARWEALLSTFLRDKEVILTVSPIRHTSDGLAENSRSKATLLVAAHVLRERYPNVHYFPAYEIMLDDLRDYRFYEPDMVHPSALAVDYIWEQFCACAVDKALVDALFPRMAALIAAQAHRPIHPQSEASRAHQMRLQEQQTALEEEIRKLTHKPEIK